MAIVLEELVYVYKTEADASELEGYTEAQDEAGVSAIALGNIVADLAGRLLDAGIAAAKAGFAFAKDLVFGIAESNDQIIKTAQTYGFATDELQKMTGVAELSGVPMRALTSSAKDLQFRLGEAVRGGAQPFVDALAEIGLEAKDIQGLGLQDQFGLISDRLNGLADQSIRASVGTQLLGGQYQKMNNVLQLGSEGIAELADKIEDAGGVIGGDALQAAADFQDEMLLLDKTVTSLKNVAFKELGPVVQSLVTRFREWVGQNRELIATRIEDFIRDLVDVVEKAANVALFLAENWGKLLLIFGGGKLVAGIVAVSTQIGLMSAATSAALGPIGLLAGAFIGLIVLAKEVGEALGDALSEIDTRNQQGAVKRAGSTLLGQLSPEDKAALQDAQKRRDAAQKTVDDEGGSGLGAAFARDKRDAAQREIEAINRRGLRQAAEAGEREAAEAKAAEAELAGVQAAGDAEADAILQEFETKRAKRKARKGGGKAKAKADAEPKDSLEDLVAKATGTPGGLSDLEGRGGAAALGGIFVNQDNRVTVNVGGVQFDISADQFEGLGGRESADVFVDAFAGGLTGEFTLIRDHFAQREI